jgi:hypothetical protein
VAENFRGIGMYVPSVYRWKDLDEQDLMKFFYRWKDLDEQDLMKFLFGEIWIQNVGDVDF